MNQQLLIVNLDDQMKNIYPSIDPHQDEGFQLFEAEFQDQPTNYGHPFLPNITQQTLKI